MKSLLTLFLFFLYFHAIPQTLKAFGDSNTADFVDLDYSKKWVSLVGAELGLTVENYASAGTTIYGVHGLEGRKSNASNPPKDYATFMFGTNEAANNLISAQWKVDYKNYIQHFLAEGYNPNKLFVISPNYDPGDDPAYLAQVAQATQYSKEIALELGIKYVPLYEEMKKLFEGTPLTAYYSVNWVLVGGKHLSRHGHRLLADLFKKAVNPPTYTAGQYRVKLFGAGSAMAGYSSYHHSFVHLFGDATNRQAYNFSIAGTGITDLNMAEVNTGVKDILIILYGNNDGDGSPGWKNLYKSKIQEAITAGYNPQNIVLMTVTRAPNLQTNNPYNWDRIGAANVSIRQIAGELGTKLMDLETMFTQSSQFADDYHINDEANEQVAQNLKSLFGSVALPVKFKSAKLIKL